MAASASNHLAVHNNQQQQPYTPHNNMSTSSSTTTNSNSPSHHSKSKKAGKKHSHTHNHSHSEPHHSQLSYEELSNIRVRQKNLVYVVGLPINLCDEQTLKKKNWFGRFGKIKKVYCNKKTAHAARTGSCAAFITFHREKDAMNAISVMNGKPLDDGSRRIIKATTGSTKYCSYFLRGSNCSNPNCLYLHDWAHKEDVVTKEELNDFGPIHHGAHSTYSSLNSININVLNSSSTATLSHHHHLHHNGSSTPSMVAAAANPHHVAAHGQALRLSFDSRSDGTHSLNYLDDDENHNNGNNQSGHDYTAEYDESPSRLRSSSYHEMNSNRTVLSTTLSKPKSTTATTISKFDYTRVVKKGILNQDHQPPPAPAPAPALSAHAHAAQSQSQTQGQSQSQGQTQSQSQSQSETQSPVQAQSGNSTNHQSQNHNQNHNQNHAQSHIENHNQNAAHTVDYPEFPPLGASLTAMNSNTNSNKTPPVRPQKHRTKPPIGHPQHSKSKRQHQATHLHSQSTHGGAAQVTHKHNESKSEKLSGKNGNHIQPEKQPPKISLDDSHTHRASNSNASNARKHSHSHSHAEQQGQSVKFDNLVDIVSGDSSEIYIESKVDVKKSSTLIRSKSSDANRRQRSGHHKEKEKEREREREKEREKQEHTHKTLKTVKTQKARSNSNANGSTKHATNNHHQRKPAVPATSSRRKQQRSPSQSHRAVAHLLLKELLNNQMSMNHHQHSVASCSHKLSDLLPDGMLTLDELRMDEYNYCYFLQSDHMIFEQFHKLFHHLNAQKLQKSKA